MIKSVILAASILLSFNLMANEDAAHCKVMSSLAGDIMELRQQNADIASLYELLEDSQSAIIMISMAYKEPLYLTDEYTKRSVSTFKNTVFMICIDARKDM